MLEKSPVLNQSDGVEAMDSSYNNEVESLNLLADKLNNSLYNEKRKLKGQVDLNCKLKNIIDIQKNRIEELEKKISSISFMVGQEIIQFKPSPLNIIKFCKNIHKIYKESKRRKKVQIAKRILEEDRLIKLEKQKKIDAICSSKSNFSSIHKKQKIDSLLERAITYPVSNGSQFYKKYNLKIAIITDVFMYNYYKNTCDNVFYLKNENYKEIFNSNKIDLFLYVSCWEGIEHQEWRGIKHREKVKKSFEDILKICKHKNIKTAFQSIEDPSNYEYFLPLAKQFDYVFTSDSEKIDDYIKDCGHQNVFYAEFGANPMFNNPIGLKKYKQEGAFFAGSYPSRYPERCQDMQIIFDTFLSYDPQKLVIADRNSDKDDASVKFPEKYKNVIIPKIEHALLQNFHKMFLYNINFNSIQNSPTMCAMRIYELQAQGSLILSNYAKSVNSKFPNINIINNYTDIELYFNSISEIEIYENQVTAIRNIMIDKTSFDNCCKMFFDIGLIEKLNFIPKILVLTNKLSERVKDSFEKQHYQNKYLFEIVDINSINIKEYSYITFFSDDYEYEKYYLDDMINAFKYTASDYITKSSYFYKDTLIDDVNHDYTNKMLDKYRTIFASNIFSIEKLLSFEGVQSIANGYSIDPFNLNYTEYCRLKQKNNKQVNYEISVIVPIFNNGTFLIHKCFDSLRRNRIFNKMEIILIDDGSTDEKTIEIINLLQIKFNNVRTFFFSKGGSGSASRPRNKGVELSNCDLITFLDPDNEISVNGYDNLYQIYRNNQNLDIVCGYQLKVAKENKITAKFTDKDQIIIENPKEHYIKNGRFPIISTQAALIKKSIIIDNNIDFVEGGIGQDTLYAYEILCVAENIAFTSKAHIIYYAERIGSVTNQVNVDFFKKSLLLEQEQYKRLKKYGVVDIYKKYKFTQFFQDWYLEKFRSVPDECKNDVEQILSTIADLYGVDYYRNASIDKKSYEIID